MSINISPKVAYDLVKQAARLFHQGTGVVLSPIDELEHRNYGFIDELDPNPDSSIRYWANQLLFFARTVHGLLHQGLLENELLENETEI